MTSFDDETPMVEAELEENPDELEEEEEEDVEDDEDEDENDLSIDLLWKGVVKPDEPCVVAPVETYFLRITNACLGPDAQDKTRSCLTIMQSTDDESEPQGVICTLKNTYENHRLDLLITNDVQISVSGDNPSSVYLVGYLVPADPYLGDKFDFGEDLEDLSVAEDDEEMVEAELNKFDGKNKQLGRKRKLAELEKGEDEEADALASGQKRKKVASEQAKAPQQQPKGKEENKDNNKNQKNQQQNQKNQKNQNPNQKNQNPNQKNQNQAQNKNQNQNQNQKQDQTQGLSKAQKKKLKKKQAEEAKAAEAKAAEAKTAEAKSTEESKDNTKESAKTTAEPEKTTEDAKSHTNAAEAPQEPTESAENNNGTPRDPETPTTPSDELAAWKKSQGISYRDVRVGEGKTVKKGSKVSIYYVGQLNDKTVFERELGGDGKEITVGGKDVIDGVNRGVIGMKEGGKRKILVPAKFGYGEAGATKEKEIPPNSELTYTVEVKSVSA